MFINLDDIVSSTNNKTIFSPKKDIQELISNHIKNRSKVLLKSKNWDSYIVPFKSLTGFKPNVYNYMIPSRSGFKSWIWEELFIKNTLQLLHFIHFNNIKHISLNAVLNWYEPIIQHTLGIVKSEKLDVLWIDSMWLNFVESPWKRSLQYFNADYTYKPQKFR